MLFYFSSGDISMLYRAASKGWPRQWRFSLKGPGVSVSLNGYTLTTGACVKLFLCFTAHSVACLHISKVGLLRHPFLGGHSRGAGRDLFYFVQDTVGSFKRTPGVAASTSRVDYLTGFFSFSGW